MSANANERAVARAVAKGLHDAFGDNADACEDDPLLFLVYLDEGRALGIRVEVREGNFR